jgi:putative transposase
MGLTIQFESHRVELPLVYEMEHDPGVLEYYEQPPSIPLAYHAANGRRVSVMHTPDYFVIRQDSAGWVECKSSEDLQKLAIRTPNRYLRDGSGKWRCPPGEAHSSPLGLDYRVWSSAEINWNLQRNLTFVEDYLRCDPAGRDLSTRPSRLRSKQSRGFSCTNCWTGPAEFRKLTRSTC